MTQTRNPNVIGKRRWPLPAPHRQQTARRVRPPDPAEADNPYVQEIANHFQRVCAITKLNLLTLLTDWVGMLEASLRLYADNARAYVMTGQFIDDPPEVKEIYRQARERYLRASLTYPAAYREMQTAFTTTYALLIEAAAPGLATYVKQTQVSPDIIGQVFLACLRPGPAWWPYFPPRAEALAAAREAIPDGAALIYAELSQAHLRYREAVPSPLALPEAGEAFAAWFEAVIPYCQPLIVGPALLDSGVMMLAAAAQFPDWAVRDGLVHFYPAEVSPLYDRMTRINGYLYGLNGYDLALIGATQDIAAYLERQPQPEAPPSLPEPPAATGAGLPHLVRPPDAPLPPPTGRVKPPAQTQATFADLFRKAR
jgi:hypothetical protein